MRTHMAQRLTAVSYNFPRTRWTIEHVCVGDVIVSNLLYNRLFPALCKHDPDIFGNGSPSFF